MRKITLIVLHCDGIRPEQHNSVGSIDAYHRSKGWDGIGYHFWVARDGTVYPGRRLERVGAHCVGHNKHSIGICYEGGLDAAGVATDTRTPLQVKALRALVERMHARFPEAVIVGHHDLNPAKPCPCYDVVAACRDLAAVMEASKGVIHPVLRTPLPLEGRDSPHPVLRTPLPIEGRGVAAASECGWRGLHFLLPHEANEVEKFGRFGRLVADIGLGEVAVLRLGSADVKGNP